MCTPALAESRLALFDIDEKRLRQSETMLRCLNQNLGNHASVEVYHDRKEALRDADYVINAIAVGEYDPYIVSDFQIPEKYGLYQTVADTLGMGGLFRGLRTIPVMLDIARDMEEVCPDAWLLNYTNPMCIVTGAVQQAANIKCVGLCHSVQVCAKELLEGLGMPSDDIITGSAESTTRHGFWKFPGTERIFTRKSGRRPWHGRTIITIRSGMNF